MLIIPRMNCSRLRDRRRELRVNGTRVEQVLWERLRRRQLGVTFSRQIGIENFIPDFCCRSKKMIIEVDGSVHQKSDVLEYDKIRENVFENFGYKILRFTNEEVLNNLEEVVNQIKKAL